MTRWIAARLLPHQDRDWMLADLDEDFEQRRRWRRLWYVAQAASVRMSNRRQSSSPSTLRSSSSPVSPSPRGPMLSNLWQDIRYALRTLRRQPGFTTVAVLSLAVGIGLNSTIFAMVDSLLFRPLPFSNPDTLVSLYTSDDRPELYGTSSYPDLLDWRAADLPFDALIGHSMMFAAVGIGGENRLAFGEVVTANFFDVLGVGLARGRSFLPEEEAQEGAAPVAIISDRIWERNFGREEDVVGKTFTIRNRPYSIVGIAPAEFNGMMPGVIADLWIPISMVDDVEPAGQIDVVPSATGTTRLQRRGSRWLFVKGRLKDGGSTTVATTQLRNVMASLEEAYPMSNKNRRATVTPVGSVRFHPDIDAILQPAGIVLLVSVGLVLLIACSNLAGMLLARGASRTRELALRAALGANRRRLIWQMTVESVVLSLIGGSVGLVMALWMTSALASIQLPIDIPMTFSIPIDWRLIGFTALLSVLTGLAFGILPALRASRPDLVASLKDEGALNAPGRKYGLRQGLVVAQVAVSVVLLVGGLLLTRSLAKALDTDPGLVTKGLVDATISLDMHGYESAQANQFFERAIVRARAIPGVQSVSVANRLSFSVNVHTTTIVIDGHPEATPERGLSVDTRDTPDSTLAAIVSEAFASRYFPDGAVGQRLRLRDQGGPVVEIIGVNRNYAIRSVAEAPRPVVHFSRDQRPSPAGSLLIRTAADASLATQALQRELLAMEPHLVFMELGPLDRILAASLLPVSLGAALFGGLAGLAMLLAGLGLYGVIAFSVARRTREIGIRMALGSTRSLVLGQVLREALTLVLIGTALGSLLAWKGTDALGSVLVGITASDPLSYILAVALLAATATIAALVPARRAASVDPLVALRQA
ncbi:MAG: ABC transporter permease [Acidobacteria bacterium]|nr:ABC transporter permease [Acidobacteriota bacterium]